MQTLNIDTMAKSNDKKTVKDRGTAHPTVPKAGFTRRRRRLEDGGKFTTQFI